MAERLPKIVKIVVGHDDRKTVMLQFDAELHDGYIVELGQLLKLKFYGQLRRDPDAPFTAPPQPSEG